MSAPALFDGMVAVPCAVMMDEAHQQNGWLFIPHADGNWVSLCKLPSFSGKIIEHWLAEQRGGAPLQSVEARYVDLLQHLGVLGHDGALAEVAVLRSSAFRVEAVNKAMAEALASAEECRGKPSFAGVRPEWDDGYVNGIKACASVVQAAMFRSSRQKELPT